MTQLFAAVDAGGNIRFASEVPRGSACGCFCPVCVSPLVAKQGAQLQWHFAHQSAQERPECLVGAINMMHRLGADLLRQRGVFTLPDYQESVRFRHLQEVVTWKAQFLPGSLCWADRPSRTLPVATGALDNGVKVSVHILVSQGRPAFETPAAYDHAQVIVWFPMPAMAELRNLSSVREHIMRHAHVDWRHHPDVFGLVAAAHRRLQRLVVEQDNQRARAAGLRWASIAKTLKAGQSNQGRAADQESAQSFPVSSEATPVERSKADQAPEPQYDWAPDRKPRSSFIFYRLRDGTAWVVYTRVDGTQGIVAWPVFEGWDECLPPSVATPMPGDVAYRAVDLVRVLTFFSAKAVVTRTGSDPGAFEGL